MHPGLPRILACRSGAVLVPKSALACQELRERLCAPNPGRTGLALLRMVSWKTASCRPQRTSALRNRVSLPARHAPVVTELDRPFLFPELDWMKARLLYAFCVTLRQHQSPPLVSCGLLFDHPSSLDGSLGHCIAICRRVCRRAWSFAYFSLYLGMQ